MVISKSYVSANKNHHSKLNKFILLAFVGVLCIALVAVLACQPATVKAQTNDALDASQFAPVLHFTQVEKFYPTTVEYIIGSSVLKLRDSSGTASIADSAPTKESLGAYTSGDYFLENSLGTFEGIAADYSSKAATLGFIAYVHVASSGSSTVIQYWLFYAYNNGPLNDHQGDIEVVEIFLDSAGNPQTVLLSQHGAGQNAAWGDVEKVDNHPVVYVAQGSHANYFRSYQGKIGIENDAVGNDGKTIMPAELHLEMLDNYPSGSWLDFAGRWGYWGTEQEVMLGKAGPYGPVFNQDGVRWAQPESYLAATFSVNGNYLMLAWLASSFLLFFIIYIAARGAWKGWCIYRQHKKGGLMVGKFLKGRGGIGLMLGIAAIIVTIIALFLPWYVITASSEFGPLHQEGGVTLMTIDGVHGVSVNMFLGIGNSDATSGFMTLFSTQLPFAIIIGAGIALLALDVIGVKSGKSMGKKLWIGSIVAILPIILVLVFISQLPALLPFANGLFPGQSIPVQVGDLMHTIAASPLAGTGSASLPVIGATTVNWGLSVGAYLFVVAIVLRIIGGFLMYTTPDLQKKAVPQFETPPPPPPPNPTQY